MAKTEDKARELIKGIIGEGLVDTNLTRVIVRDGEKVQITKPDEKTVRFDCLGLEKSYVLMSGRLYEKEFIPPIPPETQEEEQDLEQEEEQPATLIAEQLNYKGEPEEVDTRVFKNRIECECDNIRWVKNADLFQVKKCKPCTFRDRKARRRKGKSGRG